VLYSCSLLFRKMLMFFIVCVEYYDATLYYIRRLKSYMKDKCVA